MPREQPLPTHRFAVEINGVRYQFRSCTGLKGERSVVDLEEGGYNITTRRLLGTTKFPNLVLKHGMVHAESELYKMRQLFQRDNPGSNSASTTDALTRGWNNPNRFSGSITIFGHDKQAAKYGFASAWICKWEGPDVDATKNEVAIESIEITHSGLFVMTVDQNLQSTSQAAAPQAVPPPDPANVQFPTGSTTVPTPNPALDQMAKFLADDPNNHVTVEGHTDNVGSPASNQTLSQSRADSVKQYLIGQGGKDEQITATGYGQDQPIADNGTAAGRAQNRRCTTTPG